MSMDTFPRVQALIAEALRIPASSITSALAFGEIPQWDSMGHMQIMMALETQLGLDIDADAILALTTVKAICTHLSEAHL